MQSQTQAPATMAIANVVLTHLEAEAIDTAIVCERFCCIELAWRVAQNYSGWSIASVHWNR